PEPARRGFRAPPSGAEALYADFDRGFPRKRSRRITGADVFGESTYEGGPPAPPAGQVWDEDSSRAKDQYKTPVQFARPEVAKKALPAAMPAGMARRLEAPADVGRAPRESVAQAPTPRLDYGNLRMAPARATERGQL